MKKILVTSLSIFVLASFFGLDALAKTPAVSPDIKTTNPEASKDDKNANSKPIRDKWAVVIGIDKFKDKSIPQLRFSAKDAKDFAEFLVKEGNFAPDHVKLILNENATENNIRNVLGDKWLPRRAMPDDLIVIFVSSHGSPKELDRRGANYLVAHDTFKDQLYTSGIKLEDLGPDIQDRTQCNRVVLLLDACNSGAAKVGGKGLYRSKNFDVDEISQRAGQGLVVISSSSQNQRSWESKRYKNSVFTKNLIDTLRDPNQGEKIDSVYQGLKNKVEQEVKFDRKVMQTPVMRSKWKGVPLKITVKPAQPRSVKASADEISKSKLVKTSKNQQPSQTRATVTLNSPAVSTVNNTTSTKQNDNTKIAAIPHLTTSSSNKVSASRNVDPDTQIAIISVAASNRFVLKSNKRQNKRQNKRSRRRARKALAKETISTLPRVLRDQIARQITLKTGKTVVNHDLAVVHVKKIFANQKPNFFFPQRNQMKAVSKALNARYLVMVQITQMQISEKPVFGPQASIQITTKIIDGKNGRQKAALKQGFLKPHSRQWVDKKTILKFAIPKLASDIASDVAKKI